VKSVIVIYTAFEFNLFASFELKSAFIRSCVRVLPSERVDRIKCDVFALSYRDLGNRTRAIFQLCS
jgi:hypothetical protein